MTGGGISAATAGETAIIPMANAGPRCARITHTLKWSTLPARMYQRQPLGGFARLRGTQAAKHLCRDSATFCGQENIVSVIAPPFFRQDADQPKGGAAVASAIGQI